MFHISRLWVPLQLTWKGQMKGQRRILAGKRKWPLKMVFPAGLLTYDTAAVPSFSLEFAFMVFSRFLGAASLQGLIREDTMTSLCIAMTEEQHRSVVIHCSGLQPEFHNAGEVMHRAISGMFRVVRNGKQPSVGLLSICFLLCSVCLSIPFCWDICQRDSEMWNWILSYAHHTCFLLYFEAHVLKCLLSTLCFTVILIR